jgi:peptidoglycan/LPS O-acetylase OafA/YrhL
MKGVPTAGKASRSFDLDFLRGLFVLGILIYHIVPEAPVGLGQGSIEGFFCLSGFLITRTLLRRISSGWPGLGDFAINRLRRLMPALLLYLGLVGFLNVWFARADLGLVFKSSIISILGFYNWLPGQSSEMISYSTFPRLWSFGWGGLTALATDFYRTRTQRAFNLFSDKKACLWLGLAILATFMVRNYNKTAFLKGWLVVGVAIAGCIVGLVGRQKTERPLFGYMPFSALVAKIGVACYPIYLFQLFEKNLAVNLIWPFSLSLSIILGLAVHEWLEKLFYPFPTYQ